MEEERNELLEQETNKELAEKTEDNQTPTVEVEDNFTSGLLIGGAAVLLGGTAVKIVKNRKKIINYIVRLFGGKKAKPEETNEPIDVDASEVDEDEEE